MFKSAVSQEEAAVTGAIKSEINGKVYYVGTGIGTVDVNKANSELTRVLLLTDLALNGTQSYKIVTGLPIAQYKSQREQLKRSIMGWNHSTVNGKQILIDDVTVFPQAAGALYSQNIQDDCIIVDIGGRTVDIGLFEYANGKFTLAKSNSLYRGMKNLYSDIVKSVNERFELSLESNQGEKILRKGLLIDGEKQNISFLQPVINSYVEPVKQELLLNYPVRSTNVLLCGGGASTFKDPLGIPSAVVLENSQFSNAVGFHKVGLAIYGGKSA
jgi:plasmid segregation protein ParM